MKRFANKVLLATGAGSGIGRATALRFLDEGARVVIGDYNMAGAEQTIAIARERGFGDQIVALRTDVASEDDNAALVKLALDRFGRLDMAFLNAGVGGAFGPLTDTRVQDWDYTFAVLARGVFLGMKHCAAAMREQGSGGAIVVTASIAGVAGGGGSHAYSAAKAAAISLTGSAAVELAAHRIRVNAIAPGTVLTPLFHRGRPDSVAGIVARQPWPDAGQPEHIAGVVAFLCSDDAVFVTGETVIADGGRIAQGVALFGDGADNLLTQRAGVNHGTTGLRSRLYDKDD